ncbi:hypothetical protein [Marinomonas aquiplantarum]|uniref:Uncharacterized protein n=1 Tax=Marinomonas aquiplantarum TaxID=491951 RepID=A0A366CXM4_9GAMM|nr:hypothetical protein [Marinomonas aquiplantarum]RBO82591.1 hypothetical protein DFP76_10555 [Marinomonas aquiplantarum]
MNTNQYNWQEDLIAGHDQNSHPITVRQLIEAINGYESLCTIASMSDSMRDNLARAAAENYRVKLHNENLQRTINQLEQQLNSANARISQLLNEHADIDNSKALAILAQYADPTYWRNPYNQHGELDTQQRSVFAKGYHGYELAMSVIKTAQQVA